MSKICIQFDECKPHWAKQRGYEQVAAELGLTNIRLTGDFDAKITYLIGDVDNFEAFKTKVDNSSLAEGSLHKVIDPGGDA
jgi:hypothetical protein